MAKSNRRKSHLICLSGVDGSGKSTQIQALADALTAQGYVVRVRWFRPGYSTRLDRLRSAIRRVRPTAIPDPDPTSESRSKAFDNLWLQRSWVAAALVDSWIEYAISARMSLMACDILIFDRHLVDAEIDLSLNFPSQQQLVQFGIALIRRSMRRPNDRLLILVDLDTAEARRLAKNEPFPDDEQATLRRSALYDPKDPRWRGVTPIAGAGDPNSVTKRIRASVALEGTGAELTDIATGRDGESQVGE